jgi:hypothetical protein
MNKYTGRTEPKALAVCELCEAHRRRDGINKNAADER